jgi:hypothetical protein
VGRVGVVGPTRASGRVAGDRPSEWEVSWTQGDLVICQKPQLRWRFGVLIDAMSYREPSASVDL